MDWSLNLVLTRMILLATLAFCSLGVSAQQILRRLDESSFAALEDRRGLHLDVRTKGAAELDRALRFYTGTFGGQSLPATISRTKPTRAFVPFSALSPVYRKMVVAALWPKDHSDKANYYHQVTYAGHETLWSISAWLTGSGKYHRQISAQSGLRSSRIKRGQTLKVPLELLDRALAMGVIEDDQRDVDPVVADQTPIVATSNIEDHQVQPLTTTPSGGAQAQDNQQAQEGKSSRVEEALSDLKASRSLLRYGTDQRGRYAEYQLRRGEAIYSAVVVRFCGLVSGEDVNRVAGLIIGRNGIRDETDLPVGYRIRIPYEYLEPEFRRADDPEYVAFVENIEEVSKVAIKVESRDLGGVYVFLDAGHGGLDTGAKFGDVWEDDFVYDITCRVKARLESESKATVIMVTYDPSVGYKMQDVSRFRLDRDEVLRTTPNFSLNTTRVAKDGVNLRWMYSNYHFRRLTEQGVKPENIVFASFHADSLHPSLRGAMVYIPDARYYPSKVGPPSSRYARFLEYKHNTFGFSKRTMRDAQARSTAFAQQFVQQSKIKGIRVHSTKPIRSVIHRHARSRPFVPAVLRYNRVPTRCLVEVCNLANSHDRELLRQPKFRQAVAEAFVAALTETYGVQDDMARSASVVRASRTP